MSEELKPVKCGCGGEAKIRKGVTTECWWVECSKCRVSTMWGLRYTEAEAVDAWNKAMGADHICKNCKNYDGSYCKFDNEYSIAEDYGCNCFERRES